VTSELPLVGFEPTVSAPKRSRPAPQTAQSLVPPPCSLVDTDQHLRGTYCLHKLMMEAVSSCEISVSLYQIIKCYIPEKAIFIQPQVFSYVLHQFHESLFVTFSSKIFGKLETHTYLIKASNIDRNKKLCTLYLECARDT
jgi:hypothetical protein